MVHHLPSSAQIEGNVAVTRQTRYRSWRIRAISSLSRHLLEVRSIRSKLHPYHTVIEDGLRGCVRDQTFEGSLLDHA